MGLWGFTYSPHLHVYSRNGATNRLCANPSEWWFVLISKYHYIPLLLLGLRLVLHGLHVENKNSKQMNNSIVEAFFHVKGAFS